jgi:hypothetical protein
MVAYSSMVSPINYADHPPFFRFSHQSFSNFSQFSAETKQTVSSRASDPPMCTEMPWARYMTRSTSPHVTKEE